jgi:hypothetical protein
MSDKIERRMEHLIALHAHQHKVVETLEAEKAPEDSIKSAKVKKLQIKDMIEQLKGEMKNV